MSARKLAEACGTTESSIYRWELRRERSVPLMYELALQTLVRRFRRRERGELEECAV